MVKKNNGANNYNKEYDNEALRDKNKKAKTVVLAFLFFCEFVDPILTALKVMINQYDLPA